MTLTTLLLAWLMSKLLDPKPKKEKKKNSKEYYSNNGNEDYESILEKLLNDQTPYGSQFAIDRVKTALDKMNNMISSIKYSKAKTHIDRVKVGTVKEETNIPTEVVVIRPIMNMNEITKVLPSQMGMDDDLFYAKLSRKQLLVKKYEGIKNVYKSEIKKTLPTQVILVDCSGSMQGVRIDYATELVSRLVKRAAKAEARIIVIPFSSKPFIGAMTDADEPHEYKQLQGEVQRLNEFSGGTDIDAAIHAGIDVFESLESYTNGQILLATDGDQGIGTNSVLSRLQEFKLTLHTLCIGEYHNQLKGISENYDYVDLPKHESVGW